MLEGTLIAYLHSQNTKHGISKLKYLYEVHIDSKDLEKRMNKEVSQFTLNGFEGDVYNDSSNNTLSCNTVVGIKVQFK